VRYLYRHAATRTDRKDAEEILNRMTGDPEPALTRRTAASLERIEKRIEEEAN